MKYSLTIFISVFFILFSIFVAQSDEKINKKQTHIKTFLKEFSGKTKVIDGDSIIVGKKEVRLFGIDAPEYKQTCLNKENTVYNCGKMSFYYLKNLVDKKQVRCSYNKKDIYNRYLAKCYFGEISINENLLENGMAVIYNYHNSSQKLIDLEKKSKINKTGVWQGAFELPRHYRKRNK